MIENMIEQCGAKDIVPIFSGHQICKKNHKFGPSTRNYYLVHFCLSGSGELTDKYGRHFIKKGELFIIRPGEITTYCADSDDPWEYAWIAFGGSMAEVFSTDRSVYPFPMEVGLSTRELSCEGVCSPFVFISLIYRLIHSLFSEMSEKTDLAERTKQYIKFNYMNDLTVSDIATHFGYERSYLFRVFKRAYGVGVKEYILKVRMQQAKILLEKGYSVGRIAYAVGYNDQSGFSKAFKKYFGFSPSQE